MKDGALWLDSKEDLKKWLDMLESETKWPEGNAGSGGLCYYLDVLCGGPLKRINSIREHLGMQKITVEEIKKRRDENG